MKIKTLGLLAAAGMFLSSLTVWSLTTPGASAEPPADDDRVSSGSLDPAPPLEADLSQFVSGNTLLVEGRLGFKNRQAGRQSENFVFLDITAKQGLQGQPSPLNLAIVLDRSGSMQGKRLDNALAAARGMIGRLKDGDVISLVTYNTAAEVRIGSTEINAVSRARVLSELDAIHARGDTCISCGLEAGSELLSRRQGMIDQMLLLSDGEATTGVKEVSGFRRIAAAARRMGTAISTIGVDVDYNEQVMAAIAQESNGRHHFVENPSTLGSIFDEELKSLANTVADEAELSVSLAPGVRVLEVFDRSYRQEGERLVVPLGAFSAGDEKTFLIKVSVPAGAAAERPVADVHLAYRDLTTNRSGSCEGQLAQQLVFDVSRLGPLDPLVASRLERSETAAALLGANQLFKEGKAEEARSLLSRAKAKARSARKSIAQNPFTSGTKSGADLDRDLGRQERVLEEAEAGMQAAPAAAGAGAPRRAKAQVRANQESASDLAF